MLVVENYENPKFDIEINVPVKGHVELHEMTTQQNKTWENERAKGTSNGNTTIERFEREKHSLISKFVNSCPIY